MSKTHSQLIIGLILAVLMLPSAVFALNYSGRQKNEATFETLEDQLPPRVPDDPGYPPLIYKRQFVPPKDMVADPKP